VAHHSADAELRSEPLIAELMKAEPASAVFACDGRGIGESQPTTTGQGSLANYGNDYFYAAYGLMLDAPYAGQKTRDVLRVVEWLKATGYAEIHLVARAWGAIPATFAAVLSADGEAGDAEERADQLRRPRAERELQVAVVVPGAGRAQVVSTCRTATAPLRRNSSARSSRGARWRAEERRDRFAHSQAELVPCVFLGENTLRGRRGDETTVALLRDRENQFVHEGKMVERSTLAGVCSGELHPPEIGAKAEGSRSTRSVSIAPNLASTARRCPVTARNFSAVPSTTVGFRRRGASRD